jgi:hypothetical protein
MERILSVAQLTITFCVFCGGARAHDEGAVAIVDKAIASHGGEKRLRAIRAFRWESKGKMRPDRDPSEFTNRVTVDGLDRYRGEFEWGFNGTKYKTVMALNGDQAWRQSNNRRVESGPRLLAEMKHTAFVHAVTTTLIPLKADGVKLESAGETRVGDKLASAVRVTGTDGREFTLWFDKVSGLLLKAAEIPNLGPQAPKITTETTFDNYVKSDGIYRATKISQLNDGQRFREEEITRFQVLEKVALETFERPK